jgi:K+-H+ exchange-related protein
MTTLPDSLVVLLIPVAGGRFELDSEPPDEGRATAGAPDGVWRRRLRTLQDRWDAAVAGAERAGARGWMPWLRDRAIRSVAESIDEQRTLWRLRQALGATLVYPADVGEATALAESRRLLAHARRHHAWWLAFDGLALVVSGVLAIIPGPNLIAYYFAMRVVGHLLSWRGAQRGLGAVSWRARPGRAGDDRRVILPRPAVDD